MVISRKSTAKNVGLLQAINDNRLRVQRLADPRPSVRAKVWDIGRRRRGRMEVRRDAPPMLPAAGPANYA